MNDLIECFRPTGQKELDLVAASGYTQWPPRLPDQDIFYPVTNEDYAIALTQWNITYFWCWLCHVLLGEKIIYGSLPDSEGRWGERY
jgi:hypothetical protein